ncbi:hypothetical protein [uncultured Thiohalocapsa sp.]|uniref:hypothetical protein n=1 Tax=uncultured Thiohalocapsa sp. TaxID=768990 RepID=UPI0025E71077|nr:hypothetical protein [uncultured Thiohalocapsa sp.]
MIAAIRCLWPALLPLLWAGAANACQICIPLPERTLADKLLASDAVVLAREDASRPFHYQVIETLFGKPGNAPIELFLHSQARRMLAADSQRAMVLTHSARDGSWSTLGFTTPEFDRVLRGVLAQVGRWRPHETENRERLEWFAPLLGHPDKRLHELAYLEIGRAPYAEIRRLAPRIDAKNLRRMLDDPRYLEWRSLAILMLGESGRPQDQIRVRQTLADKARVASTTNLTAWATALVAVDGVAGIEQLGHLYASKPGRSRDELDAVLQALSIHAKADPELRGAVADLYRRILAHEPSMAPAMVHDLIAWRRWDFLEPIRQSQQDLADDPLAAYALGLYLRLAISNESLGRSPKDRATTDRSVAGNPAQE